MPINKTKQTSKTAKYIATIGSIISVLYVFAILTITIGNLFRPSYDDLLPKIAMMVWFLVSWCGGWLIFAIGTFFSTRYKAQLRNAGLPLTHAKVLQIMNIVGIAAVPVSFVLFFIGYAVTCTGSC